MANVYVSDAIAITAEVPSIAIFSRNLIDISDSEWPLSFSIGLL